MVHYRRVPAVLPEQLPQDPASGHDGSLLPLFLCGAPTSDGVRRGFLRRRPVSLTHHRQLPPYDDPRRYRRPG